MDCPGFSIRSAKLRPSSASLQLPHNPGRLLGSKSWLATLPGRAPGLAAPGPGCAVHAPCYAPRTSPQGLILQGPALAQLSTSARVIHVRLGHFCTWRKSWAGELLQDRRHASQWPRSPREARALVTVSHCPCSFRH